MVEIDSLDSISPQASITDRRSTSDIKQKKNPPKSRKENKRKTDSDDDHKLDEYA